MKKNENITPEEAAFAAGVLDAFIAEFSEDASYAICSKMEAYRDHLIETYCLEEG